MEPGAWCKLGKHCYSDVTSLLFFPTHDFAYITFESFLMMDGVTEDIIGLTDAKTYVTTSMCGFLFLTWSNM